MNITPNSVRYLMMSHIIKYLNTVHEQSLEPELFDEWDCFLEILSVQLVRKNCVRVTAEVKTGTDYGSGILICYCTEETIPYLLLYTYDETVIKFNLEDYSNDNQQHADDATTDRA